MPPALEAMDDHVNIRQVSISLSDVNEQEPFSHRIFTLKSPDWSIEIGRGNSMEQGSIPGPENAWFTSKVVSRHHATIKAHPRSMILTIEDNNSMHGTWLNETPVKREALELLEGDEITFGTDIVRHAETFSPLKTRIAYEWIEEGPLSEAQPTNGRNTFTADFSDQDIFSDIDDDVQVVRESIRQPSIEVLQNDFTKPITTSSNNSPSTHSAKSTSASSATTTRIDLSSDEEAAIAKAKATSKVIINLDDAEAYDSDMDDYPISPSENFSLGDMEDSEGESSELRVEAQALVPPPPSAREPSPSDAALPALRSIPPPRFQSVPSFASLMPPPPPLFTTSNDAGFRSPEPPLSPFLKSFSGTSPVTNHYYSSQSFVQPPQFSYDFSAMSHPSSVRSTHFTTASPPWTYPSVHPPEPPTFADYKPTPGEEHHRLVKRKADEISIDSEEDSDLEEPTQIPSDRPEDVPGSSQLPLTLSSTSTPDSPISKDTEYTTEIFPVVQDTGAAGSQIPEVEVVSDEAIQYIDNEIVEPPRKRARIVGDESVHRPSTMRVIAKYAATASAGAVIGAVGVIIGLASLPPDYFV